MKRIDCTTRLLGTDTTRLGDLFGDDSSWPLGRGGVGEGLVDEAAGGLVRTGQLVLGGRRASTSCSRTSWARASERNDRVRCESRPPADCTTTSDSPVRRASSGRPTSTAWTRSNRTCRCWRNTKPVRSSMRVRRDPVAREPPRQPGRRRRWPAGRRARPDRGPPQVPVGGVVARGTHEPVGLLRHDVGHHREEREAAAQQRGQRVQVLPVGLFDRRGRPVVGPVHGVVHRVAHPVPHRVAHRVAHSPARWDSPRAASRSRRASASAVGRPGMRPPLSGEAVCSSTVAMPRRRTSGPDCTSTYCSRP